MPYTIKYIAQICDTSSGEVIEQEEVYHKEVAFPTTIDEFGLRHKEQIALIKKSQDIFLNVQSKLLTEVDTKCSECGKTASKRGVFKSDFHDVLTDHIVHIQRMICTCGWKNKFSITKLYGNTSHPELVELQAEMGATHSFEKASSVLNKKSAQKRKINNSVNVLRKVNTVGEKLQGHLMNK